MPGAGRRERDTHRHLCLHRRERAEVLRVHSLLMEFVCVCDYVPTPLSWLWEGVCVHSHTKAVCADVGACLCSVCPPDCEAVCLGVFS